MIHRFTIQVVLRISLILGSCILLAVFVTRQSWFTVAGITVVILLMVISLIRYVNLTNYTLSKFLDALKTGDHSVYFSEEKIGPSFRKLFRDFNEILRIFKQNKISKEAQYEYFNHILEQIPLGIISIKRSDLNKLQESEEILFLNQAACDLLGQPRHKYWHRLARQVPWLAEQIRDMADGGKKLIDLGTDSRELVLSIEVVEIEFMGIPYLIVSLQDIQTEIEQKEMEAWHNIIRVLSHEMMNSFTPVSSLASTIKTMTEDEEGMILDSQSFDNEMVEDINLAASTIHKRAEGLMEFVNDYRTLSNVPVPEFKRVNLREFCQSIEVLMRGVVEEKGITLELSNIPPRIHVNMDVRLIEQVLINLIGNSIHALTGIEEPKITISCEVKPDHIVVLIHDNGKGIPTDIRKNIFVPFYTTRTNGSGIGLSLSKSIMKQHGGNIFVNSKVGKFTIFSLTFPM